MDLSTGVGDLEQEIKTECSCSGEDCFLDDILDLSELDMDNEETWLYKTENESDTTNIRDLLEGKNESQLPPEFDLPKLKSADAINTRTFTRPKKKSNRPSINDIEQMYNSESEGASGEEIRSFRFKMPQTVQEDQEPVPQAGQPLQFDMSQPTSMHNFDSFILNDNFNDISQLQNMSPPSLLNSLTFSNLMESSFIKNDVVLSKIRDKDYTETVLLEDLEAPMFQSITESCSSLSSDTPENFLRKVTREHMFRNNTIVMETGDVTVTPDRLSTFTTSNTSDNSQTRVGNSTFSMGTKSNPSQFVDESNKSRNSSSGQHSANLNGTYRRPLKHNGTFTKADCTNNRLSSTYKLQGSVQETAGLDNDASKGIENSMNHSNRGSSDDVHSTISKYSGKTEILRSDSIEEMKKTCSSSSSSVDLNGLNCSQEDIKHQLNATYSDNKVINETNRIVDMKRSSLGSADSLDRLSSLSSSSKGSNKRLSMEDVQAIAHIQEKSLEQAMSTPNGALEKRNLLWDHEFMSPITVKDTFSDSELSDEYKSVKSHVSSKITLRQWEQPNAKSLSYLALNKDFKIKANQRAAYTLSGGPKPLQALQSNLRGSCTNINTMKCSTPVLGGSHQNLYKSPTPPITHHQPVKPALPTNLKTMGTKLKGSYTSLRPISANLPVVPPKCNANDTFTFSGPQTSSRSNMVNVTQTSTTRNHVLATTRPVPSQSAGDSTFVRPQIVRASGLPRPTGIPRPASRIPGPRSNIIRKLAE